MFWGEYSHQLDMKGRVIIPSRFRENLTPDAILTRGIDRHLVIYPEETWQSVTQQVNQMPITNPSSRALRRLLFSGAMQLELDKQGRLNIPQYLRDYAKLEDTVLLIGMETFIELWNPEHWRKTLDGVSSILANSEQTLSLNF